MELLVVIAILAVILSMAITSFIGLYHQQCKNQVRSEAKSVYTKISEFAIEEVVLNRKYVAAEGDTTVKSLGDAIDAKTVEGKHGLITLLEESGYNFTNAYPDGELKIVGSAQSLVDKNGKIVGTIEYTNTELEYKCSITANGEYTITHI